MRRLIRRFAGCLPMLAALALWAAPAEAHPHVWVTSSSELIYGADGAVTGIRHSWRFDDMFSSYALQDIEPKTKGVYTREELAPLAQINVDSLREFDFFTFARTGKTAPKEAFLDPVDYFLEYKDGALILNFTLPFKAPVKARQLAIEIYDPSYFVAFGFDKGEGAASLVGGPKGCSISVNRPLSLTPQDQLKLQQAMSENFSPGEDFALRMSDRAIVACP